MANRQRSRVPVTAELLEKRQLLSNSIAISGGASATYAVGLVPTAIAVGDFNGDGKPDMAVANFGGNTTDYEYSNTISILDGNGDGTFQPQYTIAAGNSPYDVISGDFNGDGNDLAVTDEGSNQVEVLLSNGNGTFAKEKYPVGSKPTQIVSGDLITGDSNADLVVANYGSNTVSILLGNGNGTFQSQYTVAVGQDPHNIALADLTGNGNLDLIVSCPTPDKVKVLMGNGNGTFGAPQALPLGSSQVPESVVTGNFSGDGVPDIAVALNYDNGGVQMILNNGNGTFAAGQRIDNSGGYPSSIEAVSMSNNSIPDLVVTSINAESNVVQVFPNNGNGTFGDPVTSHIGQSPTFVISADLTGDGAPDLLVATVNNAVDVVLNESQFATASNGVLTITGDESQNTISVTDNSGAVTATLNGINAGPFDGLTGISVSAGGGEGTLNLSSVPIAATVIATNGYDTITGSDGGDSIRAHGIDNFITGGAGNDTLIGPGGSDTIFASGSGNDFLKAKHTDNKLRGSTGGDDTLVGGSGGDTLKGHGGNNSILGGSGAELIHGFAGDNTIVGGSGPDTITGNYGNNTITAGSGGGEIVAGFGDDSITGSTTSGYLADSIYCGSGFDTVVAGTSDPIYDSTANDSITGGTIVS